MPFTITEYSNDLSVLTPFGLLDVFDHLMSSEDYDKEKLSSWRSFDERILSRIDMGRPLGVKTVKDCDNTTLFY